MKNKLFWIVLIILIIVVAMTINGSMSNGDANNGVEIGSERFFGLVKSAFVGAWKGIFG